MPKVTYSAAQGLVQSAGSGFSLDTTVGLTNNGFFAGFIPDAGSTTATSGAISVASYVTFIDVTATKAFTIAAGSAAGQLKKIMCVNAASTPQGTLTITNPVDASTDSVLFTVTGDTLDLIWTGSAWRVLGAYNVANGQTNTPVVS